jgi:hypothetical protein
MQALNRRLLAVFFMLFLGAAITPRMHAATVAISNERFSQCWFFGIVCDGQNAFSLTQLENGTVQLPVNDNNNHEFVIVNDTGQRIRTLQLYFIGDLSSSTSLNCQLQGTALLFFQSCLMSESGSSSRPAWELRGPITAPVEFTFSASPWQWGITPGAYFDVVVTDFGHCGFNNGTINGYITGTLDGSSGGNPEKISATAPLSTPDSVLRSYVWLDQR